jgi:hypothetical protein
MLLLLYVLGIICHCLFPNMTILVWHAVLMT